MTEPADKKKRERLDPNIAQRQASDPLSSVWVTASAGTGKTKVLTDRVLRLMLSGAAPDEILCLTFTRAGASVMTTRIREELSRWATCDDAELSTRLLKLQGRKPDEETTMRARRLFAEFLDSHGGMRVQTIHSFSQDLIRRFPIETGVPPYFDVMDDQTAVELLRESQADVLRQIRDEPDSPLARAVRMITPEVNEDDFAALIGELTYRRGQLISMLEKLGGLEDAVDHVYAHLSAQKGYDSRTLNEKLNSDEGLYGLAPDIAGLNAAADILAGGSATDLERAKMIKAWILHPERRVEFFWDYASVFLTADFDLRKRLTTKASAGAEDALRREGRRLIEGIEVVSTMNVARGTESILRLTTAILEKYKAKKRAANLLDYDDLIHSANVMMEQDNASAWVLQKLPGNLRHILVDEAQDTNPDQWKLVTAIAGEFFRQGGKGRTIFVVGDEKQSIFSFQRANPREFGRQKKLFADMVEKGGGKWREVDLEIAFRSSPAITRAVDAVFAEAAASDGLFFEDAAIEKQVRHSAFRRGQAGLVEVHPVIRVDKPEELQPWSLPLQMENASDPDVMLAEDIADKIEGWLESGEKLASRNRAISPDDIMILVRRRSSFVDDMVRALKKRDVPVAGADRMSLREQIVVMDLVALGEVLLFPRDDYKLACVLKSPLIGMTDAQLESIAATRTGDLWTALETKAAEKGAAPVYAKALEWMNALRDNLNAERPYEFYSSILMNACPANERSGLNALYGRLGFEAEDPLVEFLNAVEKFEKNHAPSLQGFLSWLDAGEAEVKREITLNPESPRVHIMTVHGAKGLEAPVVILPDTTGLPSDNARARPRFLWPDDTRDVPLWVPRSDLENSTFRFEREKAEKERDREFRRLLYVAMTRAADRLYVFGADNAEKTPDDSWYSLIRKGLMKNLADDIVQVMPANDDNNENGAEEEPQADKIIRFEVAQTARPVADGVKVKGKLKVVGVPAWAKTDPPVQKQANGRFKPSEYKAMNDNYAAASPLRERSETFYKNLGTAVHQLLEFLPALPEADRAEAARRHLAKPVWKLEEKDQKETLDQVLGVLNHPHFGALFGAKARAEVSITGQFNRAGQVQTMSGQIDRLVVDDKYVTIVDFKNSVNVPDSIEAVPFKYIVQMAAYKLALSQIYPDKKVRCALLWTRKAKLMPVPDDRIEGALKKLDLRPSNPPNPPSKPAGPTI